MDINSPLMRLYQKIMKDNLLREHWTDEMKGDEDERPYVTQDGMLFHHGRIKHLIPVVMHDENLHTTRSVQVT